MKKYLALLFAILIAPAALADGVQASYAEASLSSCPINTAQYVVVDAYYQGCHFDQDYLPTFKSFTTADGHGADAPYYTNASSISFYHIESSNAQAAQACFGIAITGSPTTLVFKNGQLIAQSPGDKTGDQLYSFLTSDPVSLQIG